MFVITKVKCFFNKEATVVINKAKKQCIFVAFVRMQCSCFIGKAIALIHPCLGCIVQRLFPQ